MPWRSGSDLVGLNRFPGERVVAQRPLCSLQLSAWQALLPLLHTPPHRDATHQEALTCAEQVSRAAVFMVSPRLLQMGTSHGNVLQPRWETGCSESDGGGTQEPMVWRRETQETAAIKIQRSKLWPTAAQGPRRACPQRCSPQGPTCSGERTRLGSYPPRAWFPCWL